MKKGLLFFHQGVTDIINCLPLINHYLKSYDKIAVLLRDDLKELFNYYIADKPNVKGAFFQKSDLDFNFINVLNKFSVEEYDFLFHGHIDSYRQPGDPYREVFGRSYNPQCDHFVKIFYTAYNIPYETRINNFEYKRNIEHENEVYEKFISKYGSRYALYHDNTQPGNSYCKIDLPRQDDITHINLNQITPNIFEMLKVIECSIGDIHVIDSSWGSFLYLQDCKTGILKNRNVYLYPFQADCRSGGCLFGKYDMIIEPNHPRNWTISS